MNRDYTVPRKDEIIFAECRHCGEPQTYTITQRDLNGNVSLSFYNDSKYRCYCRGANALSLKISCCQELKCSEKKDNTCTLVANTKTEYPPKRWNSIVVE